MVFKCVPGFPYCRNWFPFNPHSLSFPVFHLFVLPVSFCRHLSYLSVLFICSQTAGPPSECPFRHQCVGSPGGFVEASEAGLSSWRSSSGLQRGDRALLPPNICNLQPQQSDCDNLTSTSFLAHTRSAPTSASAARKRGQQEHEKYEGEIPEAPAGVTVDCIYSPLK